MTHDQSLKTDLLKYDFLVWLLIFFFSFFCLVNIQSYDIWWHLSYGRFIWETCSLPIQDTFTWTHQGHPNLALPWLSSFVFYFMYNFMGEAGLVICKGLVVSICLGGTWLTLRQQRIPWFWFALVLVVAFPFIQMRLTLLRSFVTMFIFFPFCHYLWYKSGDKVWSIWRWCIPTVFVLWCNSHGSFPVPLLWLVLFSLWPLIWDCERRKKEILPSLLMLSTSGLATLLMPNTLGTWRMILSSLVEPSSQNLQLTQEATKLIITSLEPYLIFCLFFIYLLTVIAGLNLSWKKHGHQFIFFGFVVLQSYKSQRFLGLMALVSILYLPVWIHELKIQDKMFLKKLNLSKSVNFIMITGLIVMLPLIYWQNTSPNLRPVYIRDIGFGVSHHLFPTYIDNFISDNKVQGKMYNEFHAGGYLYWKHPERQVFADGRTNVLISDDFFMKNFGDSYLGNGKTVDMLNKWGVTYAIVGFGPAQTDLRQNPQWFAVAFDDQYVLYLKSGQGNDEIIQKNIYRVLGVFKDVEETCRVWDAIGKASDKSKMQLLIEIRRALVEMPYQSVYIRGMVSSCLSLEDQLFIAGREEGGPQ